MGGSPDNPFWPDNPVWDFSLSLYDRPGVAGACLALQDRHGLDVNLLLLCSWAGAQGRLLGAAEMARLRAAAAAWQQQVIRPLRGVRRWLKTQAEIPSGLAEPLRAAVKELELEAERIEQQRLYEALGGAAGDAASGGAPAAPMAARAAANLRAYLDLAGVPSGVPWGAGDKAALVSLLRGAFPALSEEEAGALVA